MKDVYPSRGSDLAGNLVPPYAQPDYREPDGHEVADDANVGNYLSDRQVVLGRGDQVAAIHGETGRAYTFAALAVESTRLAGGLVALGVRIGDRVAYRSPNVPEALIVLLAIWKAGAVAVPIPTQATDKDIGFYCEDTGARLLIAHERSGSLADMREATKNTKVEEILAFGDGDTPAAAGFRTVADIRLADADGFSPPDMTGNDIAILWHTGGTTGRPKGCYHTHRRFLLGGYAIGAGTGIAPGERWSAAAPIGHALGIIYHTIYTLLHGATVVLIENFHDARNLLECVGRNRIDTLTALSASWMKMLEAMQADPALDFSSIKRAYAMWQSASSSYVYESWKEQGIVLLNNFGSTAFATWVLAPRPGLPSPRASLGVPIPGYEVAAVRQQDGHLTVLPPGEIGQMAVKGPTGLTYWNRPEMQSRDVVDGWTLSDDLIQYDSDGNAHYLGRTDYMISTGGFKVAPVEVEEVLARHPAVLEVAVVPAPCPIRQQKVVAFVALRTGYAASGNLAKELRDFAKSEMVSYKAPQRIRFTEALPRDHVGKVQTKIVLDWAMAEDENDRDGPLRASQIRRERGRDGTHG